MSVCTHGTTRSHWTDFDKTLYFIAFRKSVDEIKIYQEWLGAAHVDQITLIIIPRWILDTVRSVLDTSCRERKHILCTIQFFPENRAVYEIMWKNIVERGRTQMAIWRMRVACWIPKAKSIFSLTYTNTNTDTHTHTHTHTHRLCNTYCFPRQQWLRERASMLRYPCMAWTVKL